MYIMLIFNFMEVRNKTICTYDTMLRVVVVIILKYVAVTSEHQIDEEDLMAT